MSPPGHPASPVGHPVSLPRHPAKLLGLPVSSPGHLASLVGLPVSPPGHPASPLGLLVSILGHPASILGHPVLLTRDLTLLQGNTHRSQSSPRHSQGTPCCSWGHCGVLSHGLARQADPSPPQPLTPPICSPAGRGAPAGAGGTQAAEQLGAGELREGQCGPAAPAGRSRGTQHPPAHPSAGWQCRGAPRGPRGTRSPFLGGGPGAAGARCRGFTGAE